MHKVRKKIARSHDRETGTFRNSAFQRCYFWHFQQTKTFFLPHVLLYFCPIHKKILFEQFVDFLFNKAHTLSKTFLNVGPKISFLKTNLNKNLNKKMASKKTHWLIFCIKFYVLVLKSMLWDISAHWCC